jgi:hypothetical protein
MINLLILRLPILPAGKLELELSFAILASSDQRLVAQFEIGFVFQN